MSGQTTVALCGFDIRDMADIENVLSQHYRVLCCDRAEDLEQLVLEQTIELVVCWYERQKTEMVSTLGQLRVTDPQIVRIMGGDFDEHTIDELIQTTAAHQLFSLDWTPPQIDLLIRRALETREISFRLRHLTQKLKVAEDVLERYWNDSDESRDDIFFFDTVVYRSAAMAQLCDSARKASATNLPVLIEGETGTGKELIARAIHTNSGRANQPLMIQNCGGMPDELLISELFGHKKGAFTGAVSDRLGLFAAADGGTVFLDEISDVSPAFQVSLLRFLQEGEVKPLGSDKIVKSDVRIIAASNRSLLKLIETNEFRQDLYFRLNGFKLIVPPLRKRREDITILADFISRKYADSIGQKILGIANEVHQRLQAYDWPGNVRELENEMKRMVSLTGRGEFLTLSSLSEHLISISPKLSDEPKVDGTVVLKGNTLREKVESVERTLVGEALMSFRWNQTRAAESLGLSRVGLANKIKRYGLDDPDHVIEN